MPISLNGTTGIQFPDNSLQTAAASPFGLKNRIINGDMVIDQRNAGASTTPTSTTANIYSLDRWLTFGSQASKFSIQQNAGSVTPPTGFTNYLGITSLSAYTVGSSELFLLEQYIEGFNIADLAWGTANARTVTLSFWVRSSLTGNFGGSLRNSADNRCYPFTYTISSANTWTQISVTIAGDTSGTWLTNNGRGIKVCFSLGSGSTFSGTAGAWTTSTITAPTGSVSVVGTNGATFYVTGVQLERNTTATPFEWIPYSTELALCQRYYQVIGGANSTFPLLGGYSTSNGTSHRFPISFPVQMRIAATATRNGTWDTSNCNPLSIEMVGTMGYTLMTNSTSNGVNWYAYPNSTDDTITFSAEL